MNGDGFDDVIVGALKQNDQFSGVAFVIYGAEERSSHVLTNSAVSTSWFVVMGPAWSWFGYSISGAGNL